MASYNALRILSEENERTNTHNHHKKILYDGGYHWMKLFSLRTLLILPVFDFFETEFIITDKGILMINYPKHEYFWVDSNLYYRESISILGLLLNYGTFTISRGGGGLGSRQTEYVYKKVKNAKLFKATLDYLHVKKVG